jgi:hypothetical protein
MGERGDSLSPGSTSYRKPMFLFMALIGHFSRSLSSNPTTRQLSVQTSLDKLQEA